VPPPAAVAGVPVAAPGFPRRTDAPAATAPAPVRPPTARFRPAQTATAAAPQVRSPGMRARVRLAGPPQMKAPATKAPPVPADLSGAGGGSNIRSARSPQPGTASARAAAR